MYKVVTYLIQFNNRWFRWLLFKISIMHMYSYLHVRIASLDFPFLSSPRLFRHEQNYSATLQNRFAYQRVIVEIPNFAGVECRHCRRGGPGAAASRLHCVKNPDFCKYAIVATHCLEAAISRGRVAVPRHRWRRRCALCCAATMRFL